MRLSDKLVMVAKGLMWFGSLLAAILWIMLVIDISIYA